MKRRKTEATRNNRPRVYKNVMYALGSNELHERLKLPREQRKPDE